MLFQSEDDGCLEDISRNGGLTAEQFLELVIKSPKRGSEILSVILEKLDRLEAEKLDLEGHVQKFSGSFSLPLPDGWEVQPSISSDLFASPVFCELARDSCAFAEISNLFFSSVPTAKFSSLEIVSISRNENVWFVCLALESIRVSNVLVLFRVLAVFGFSMQRRGGRFASKMTEMRTSNICGTAQARFKFHLTKVELLGCNSWFLDEILLSSVAFGWMTDISVESGEESIPCILRDGFDSRVARGNGALGKGVYFAERADLSLHYAFQSRAPTFPGLPPPDGEYSLLLCRVLEGRSTPGKPGLTRSVPKKRTLDKSGLKFLVF